MLKDKELDRIQRVLDRVTQALGSRRLVCNEESNTLVADYYAVTDKIYVKKAISAQLSDFELGCILAHEVGHANTRLAIFLLRIFALVLGAFIFLFLGLICFTCLGEGFFGLIVGVVVGLFGGKYACSLVEILPELLADKYATKYAGSRTLYKEVLLKLIVLTGAPPRLSTQVRLWFLDKAYTQHKK